MDSLRLVLLITFFALCCCSLTSASDVNCTGSLDRVDKCYTSIHVIGDRSFIRPKTIASMKGHCK